MMAKLLADKPGDIAMFRVTAQLAQRAARKQKDLNRDELRTL